MAKVMEADLWEPGVDRIGTIAFTDRVSGKMGRAAADEKILRKTGHAALGTEVRLQLIYRSFLSFSAHKQKSPFFLQNRAVTVSRPVAALFFGYGNTARYGCGLRRSFSAGPSVREA